MLDPQDELYDKRLARHLVSLYYSVAEENETDFMVCCHFFDIYVQISSIKFTRTFRNSTFYAIIWPMVKSMLIRC